MPARNRLTLAVCSSLLAASPLPAAGAPPNAWQTRAEESGFAATSSYAETLDYLRRLVAQAPGLLALDSFGVSGEGRSMPLVVAARDGAFSPERARAAGRPVVLIQSGIHAGEIDGKDATLLLLRDWALGRRRELLDGSTVLFVPIYNVDGHERVSPHNRPNQDGPRAGMGFRTTAQGLDLNRDHVKLASPEARALVALFNTWRPDLHVDNHVTDGADHAWVLTYAHAEAPQIAPPLAAWLRRHVPAAVAATAAAGHAGGPYTGFVDEADPAQGFGSWLAEPRFSTGYFALRNRPSILIEMHSYKPYRERVLANYEFLVALLAEVAKDPRSLRNATAEADAATVALGGTGAAASQVTVRLRAGGAAETLRMPLYAWSVEPSLVSGRPLLRYRRGEVRDLTLPWQRGVEAELTLPRPRGYLVLPGWPMIEERLRGHGLRVERVTAPAELEVETIRAGEPRFAATTYQGLTRVDQLQVERRTERRRLAAGTLWIPADQPDFEVAVQLFEPEAPDSLVAWGLLSSVFERKEYIEPRVIEELAAAMLADPKVRAEWEAALRDPAFAADPQARHLWWYRRTPYWDETVGLMPFYRAVTDPNVTTEPWK